MALSLYAVNEGFIDEVPANKVVDFEAALHAFARGNYKSVLDGINAKPEYNDANVADMKKILEAFKKTGTY
jgi:F-type H+-transporting ATPase subunit alpha